MKAVGAFRVAYGGFSTLVCRNRLFRPLQIQVCHSGDKSFIEKLTESLREEAAKTKELKENLRKLQEESEKLEQSDALQKARLKYQSVEAETVKSTERLKQTMTDLQEQIKKALDEAAKSDIGKKGFELSGNLLKQARDAADALEKSTESLGQSAALKAVSAGVRSLKEEIDDIALSRGRIYRAPEQLRMRTKNDPQQQEKTFQPNTEATGIELHKDSKWYQSWKSFSEDNVYVNKLWDWKMKYDESDNAVIRTTRFFTEKITDLFGGVFSKTELSEVLTEICKIDPSFQKETFLRECELEIIPNILEAMVRGNLEVLKDWCHEVAFNQLSQPIKRAHELGYTYDSRILDLDSVDLAMGKMVEQGPVLIITFQTNQIESVRDKNGVLVEGDPNVALKVNYVWVMCRDPEILDPKAAWKLMEIHANVQKQWL